MITDFQHGGREWEYPRASAFIHGKKRLPTDTREKSRISTMWV
jgi:hypothetical protein